MVKAARRNDCASHETPPLALASKARFCRRALDSPLATASSVALLGLPPPPHWKWLWDKVFQVLFFHSSILSLYNFIMNYIPTYVK